MTLEMRRRESLGWLQATTKKVIKGKPASITDIVINGLIGFAIGHKLGGILVDFAFFNAHPQEYILSTKGFWLGGVLMGAYGAWSEYASKNKTKLPEPKEETIVVHPYQLMWNITLVAAIAGIIGAKLFHNFENWNEFINDPVDALLSFSGLTFYGGLICGAGAVIWYARKYSINLLQLIDASAPGLMLAYGLGRMGCHLSGDGDWGITNTLANPYSWLPDWAWSSKFPHNVISEGVPIPGCIGEHCTELEFPVYPTSLYEFLMGLALFGLLWGIRKRITVPGMLFSIYLIVNGLERFLIEKVRVNNVGTYFGIHSTQAQFIACVLMIIGALGIFISYRYQPKSTTA